MRASHNIQPFDLIPSYATIYFYLYTFPVKFRYMPFCNGLTFRKLLIYSYSYMSKTVSAEPKGETFLK